MAMNNTTRPDLLLTQHTLVCLTDSVLVFLNLRNDQYACFERQYTVPIGKLLGLPVSSVEDLKPPIRPAEDETVRTEVRKMIANGFATQDSKEGKRAEFITQPSELREILGYEIGKGPKVRVGHVLNFFKALIVTKSLLRFASMERKVLRVKRRKARYFAKGSTEPALERINELVEVYKILKPLFVTVKDECLFNSLFLIEFLACYRVYPSWYFGVRLNEFYAHCWVQDKNVIYDDFIQDISANQPIMAV